MNPGIWDELAGVLEPPWIPWPVALPGHGLPRGEATPKRLGIDLHDWAEACLAQCPEQAVWLGWSLGGLIALAAALQAPRRVTGLVLVGTSPRFARAADWRPALDPATLEQFGRTLQTDPAETLARFLTLQVQDSAGARETLRRLRRTVDADRPIALDALTTGLNILGDTDLRGRLPDIACPALWLFGERDRLVPSEVAERVEILMPGARTATIPGAGHAPHVSHAQTVHAHLMAFLAACASTPADGPAP
jgi:pimeloyl-[acyl-carrier protein] methyl ester esterase